MIKLPLFFTIFRDFESRIVIFLWGFFLRMELYTLRTHWTFSHLVIQLLLLTIAEEIGFLCDLAPPAVFERHVAVINRNPRSVTVCRR